MSKTKVAIAVAGVLVVAGAVAAVSAPGHRGGWHGGPMMSGENEDGPMRGRFGRSLTKDDFDARMRERFARLDKNSDGVIEPSEIEAMLGERMEKRRHGRADGKMGERMMRRFDANRDGKVTQDEVRAEFQRRFAEADLNKDGKIDDADLPPMMRGRNAIAEGGPGMGRGRGGMGMLGWLRQADSNKDGAVTREEAAAMADREHARFDRTKDGAVDQADRDALRKEMTDYAAKRFAHHNGAGADGRVTREQFQAKAAERFARMDIDGNGTISRDERPGRWGGHGHHGRHMGHGPHHMHGHGMHGPGMMDSDGTGPGPRGPGRGGEPPAKN